MKKVMALSATALILLVSSSSFAEMARCSKDVDKGKLCKLASGEVRRSCGDGTNISKDLDAMYCDRQDTTRYNDDGQILKQTSNAQPVKGKK